MSYHALGTELDIGVETDCYKGGGSSRDTVVACAGEAGGKAAAAACVAAGAGPAAPLCNEIGTFIAKNLAGPIYDGASEVFEAIFGGPEGASPAQAQASGAWAVNGAKAAYDKAAATLVHAYAQKVYPTLKKADPSAPSSLSYESAHLILDSCGAKEFVGRAIYQNQPIGMYPASAIKAWFTGPDWWIPGREIGSQNNSAGFIFANAAADLWREQSIPKALGCGLGIMVTRAAKATALAEVKAPVFIRPTTTIQEVKKPDDEGSGKLWLVLGTVGAAGAYYYWYKKKRRRR